MNNIHFTDRQIEMMELASEIIDKKGIQELTIKNLAASIGLSEAALYRHFKSKNEILIGLLDYFILEMNKRLSGIISREGRTPAELLRDIFTSQLQAFVEKPAIVSVIFSEGIFQFNKELMQKLSAMMEMVQSQIESIVREGQQDSSLRDFVGPSALTIIITGSMRMVVLKWKLSGQKSDLVKDGNKILNGILKMVEKPTFV